MLWGPLLIRRDVYVGLATLSFLIAVLIPLLAGPPIQDTEHLVVATVGDIARHLGFAFTLAAIAARLLAEWSRQPAHAPERHE